MSTTTPASVSVAERLQVRVTQPDAHRGALALTGAIGRSGLETSLIDLIDVRVSQINGCAFCIQMHTQEAREHGETDARLHALSAWEEASVFTARERVGLALAEAITLLQAGHVSNAVWEEATARFSESELAAIVLVSSIMNFWNRVSIASRSTPGAPA
ncbi:MAG: carboxymuconolactone decarboxylase family protein [Candidatus Dormibacteraceae bacterium]